MLRKTSKKDRQKSLALDLLIAAGHVEKYKVWEALQIAKRLTTADAASCKRQRAIPANDAGEPRRDERNK